MYTKETKIKDLMTKPYFSKLVEKYMGRKISPTMLMMGANLSLEACAEAMKWDARQLQGLLDELNSQNQEGLK